MPKSSQNSTISTLTHLSSESVGISWLPIGINLDSKIQTETKLNLPTCKDISQIQWNPTSSYHFRKKPPRITPQLTSPPSKRIWPLAARQDKVAITITTEPSFLKISRANSFRVLRILVIVVWWTKRMINVKKMRWSSSYIWISRIRASHKLENISLFSEIKFYN